MILRKRKIASVLCYLIAFLMFPISAFWGGVTLEGAHFILMLGFAGFFLAAIARNQPKPIKMNKKA